MNDRTQELEARIRELEGRLGRVEGRAPRGVQDAIDQVVGPETRKHMRASWREQLLAARSFLDHWIDRMDGDGAEARVGRESIRIE